MDTKLISFDEYMVKKRLEQETTQEKIEKMLKKSEVILNAGTKKEND